MRMREFIRENREEITECVEGAYGVKPTNDREREEWVNNDEGLYLWARSSGVPV